MKLVFAEQAWADYLHWQAQDLAVLVRVDDLLADARRSPFTGMGKPEPLVGNLEGWWSRRITLEHRLVYRVSGSGRDQALEIASSRFHYRR